MNQNSIINITEHAEHDGSTLRKSATDFVVENLLYLNLVTVSLKWSKEGSETIMPMDMFMMLGWHGWAVINLVA